MKQKPKSIYEFNPGDIVTRIEPIAKINKTMFMGGLDYDNSFVGEKLIFIGTANGCAYFETTDSFDILFYGGKLISMELSSFENGWAHYIDPITLLNAKPKSKYDRMSNTNLVQKLDEAIAIEDYEEASRIKHEIDKREI